ncbi:hypothetical protein V6N13_096866 [Hibiscus sabdariffa]
MNGDVGFENINPPAMECLNTLIMRKKQSSKSRAPESNFGTVQVVLRPKHHLQLNDFLQNHQRRYLFAYHFNDFVSPLLLNQLERGTPTVAESIIRSQGDVDVMCNLKRSLLCFQHCSNLQINFKKSYLQDLHYKVTLRSELQYCMNPNWIVPISG